MMKSAKRYRLIRGDCRDVLPKLRAASVDFIFTDPPYGHNNNNGDLISRKYVIFGNSGKGETCRPIANDGPEAEDLFRFLVEQAVRLLRCCCCCCCCCCCGGGGGPDPIFARWSLLLDQVMEFKQQIIWDKGPMGIGWHYRRSTECVLVAQKGKGRCNWFDDSRRVENIIRPGDYGIKKIIPRAHQHPTEKPWQLAAHFIRLHTRPGDLVLDPFMGAGSTGEACLRLGRRFIGIELDPHWHAVARTRFRRLAKTRNETRRAAA
jgi:site-specific DNA-methyltransferase (adenine-specific)